MTRRPTWLTAAAFAGAIAVVAVSAAPAFAQGAPEAPAAAATARIPTYAEVDCAAHTFNGADYTGSIAKIEATDPSTVVFTL